MVHLLIGVSWNLFLAAIPVVLGYLLAGWLERSGNGRRVPWAGLVLLGGAWLLFLPNAPYLLTEWRHLLLDGRWAHLRQAGSDDHAALFRMAEWALAFFLYSAAGVLCFVLSIRPLERWLRETGRRPLPYAPALFFLTSLGVYLGLVVRLNSWDLVTHPQWVWSSIAEALANPTLLAAITLFAVMLWAVYVGITVWIDALSVRLRGTKPAPVRSARDTGG